MIPGTSSVGATLDPAAIEQLAQQVSARADQIAQDTLRSKQS